MPFLWRLLPDEDTEDEEDDAAPLEPARVAVIGAGVGGCCAAYFLRKKGGAALKVDVFERGVVGGRTTTFTFQGNEYETGASIIHTSNKYLVDLSQEFGEFLCIHVTRRALDKQHAKMSRGFPPLSQVWNRRRKRRMCQSVFMMGSGISFERERGG